MIDFLVQQNNIAVEYSSFDCQEGKYHAARKRTTALPLLASSKQEGQETTGNGSSFLVHESSASKGIEARLSHAIDYARQKCRQIVIIAQQESSSQESKISSSSSSSATSTIFPVINLSSFSDEAAEREIFSISTCNNKRSTFEEGMSAFTSHIALSLENTMYNHDVLLVEKDDGCSTIAHSIQENFSFKIVTATLLFNMAIYKARNCDYTSAKSYLQQALEVLLEVKLYVLDSITASTTASMKQQVLATHTLLTSITLINLGHVNWQLSLPDDSIRSYQQCLESLKYIESGEVHHAMILFHSRHIMAVCINCIGLCFLYERVLPCQAENNFQKLQSQAEICLKYLEASLALYEDCKSADIIPDACRMAFKANMATTLNNLGRVYYIINDYSQALHYHRACLRTRSFCLHSTHLDLSVAHFNVAQSLTALDECEEAMDHYHYFLSNATLILGYNHEVIIRAVIIVTDLYIDMEEYFEAETLLREYLACSEFISAESLQSKLTLLNSLSVVLHNQDKLEDALEALTQARNIILALPQDESTARSCITNYCNIGVILSKDKKIEKAVIMFHKALAKIESFENQIQFSKLLIEIHKNMAYIYESIGNYSICIVHLEKIVAIAKKFYGPMDPHVVSTSLNRLGLMYYKQHRYETAHSVFVECLHIRTSCKKNTNKSEIIAVLYNIATVYKAMGMTEEALTIYFKVLIYERQTRKEQEGRSQPKDLIITLRHIFQIYKEQGVPQDGLKYLEEAVDLCRQYKDKIGADLGRSIFFLIGEYLTLTQDVTKGFKYYCEGCELFGGVDNDTLYAAGENGLRIILAQLCTNERVFPIHAPAA